MGRRIEHRGLESLPGRKVYQEGIHDGIYSAAPRTCPPETPWVASAAKSKVTKTPHVVGAVQERDDVRMLTARVPTLKFMKLVASRFSAFRLALSMRALFVSPFVNTEE